MEGWYFQFSGGGGVIFSSPGGGLVFSVLRGEVREGAGFSVLRGEVGEGAGIFSSPRGFAVIS